MESWSEERENSKTKRVVKPLIFIGIIFGILAWVVWTFTLLFSTIAIILGVVALTQVKKRERVLCCVPIILGIVPWVLWATAVGVYYNASVPPPSAIIIGVAEDSGDDIIFTPVSPMTPSTVPAADWEYAVYSGGTEITAFTAGTATLERGVPVTLANAGGDAGDTLKIRYKGSNTFDITIT